MDNCSSSSSNSGDILTSDIMTSSSVGKNPLINSYVQSLETPDSTNYINCSIHDIPSSNNILSRFQEVENINQCSLHEIPVPKINSRPNTRTTSHVFQRSNLKLVSGMKQYAFDEDGTEFLDCLNGTAHVGHAHPQVVSAATNQMSKIATAQGFVTDVLNKYVKEIVSSFPEPLSVCYLVNSGSEANDLALRLAQQYTGHEDVISMEDGYSGNTTTLIDVSFKMHHKVLNYKKPEWSHSVEIPDTYRHTDTSDWNMYFKMFEEKLESLDRAGRKIRAFLFEPMFVIPGLYTPPTHIIKNMVKEIRSRGGLIICDEVQTGLGRTGDYMWAFMRYGIVPDILTVGKPLGNGHPMGAVITSPEVSSKLGAYFSTFGGNPVSCAIGLSVLEILKNEKLMSSARMVGKYLTSEFERIMDKHEILGDHRGCGLVHSIEIVKTKSSKLPSSAYATELMYGCRMKNILMAITGKDKNIILITPPLCFNKENARRLIETVDEVLTTIERNANKQSVIVYRERMENYSRDSLKRGIIGTETDEEECMDDSTKRLRTTSEDGEHEANSYEDMD